MAMKRKVFLAKCVDNAGTPIEHLSLLCRRSGQIDGQPRSPEEVEALEAVSLSRSSTRTAPYSGNRRPGGMCSPPTTRPLFWPIDLEAGYVTVTIYIRVSLVGMLARLWPSTCW
jgi:hypothetical protein